MCHFPPDTPARPHQLEQMAQLESKLLRMLTWLREAEAKAQRARDREARNPGGSSSRDPRMSVAESVAAPRISQAASFAGPARRQARPSAPRVSVSMLSRANSFRSEAPTQGGFEPQETFNMRVRVFEMAPTPTHPQPTHPPTTTAPPPADADAPPPPAAAGRAAAQIDLQSAEEREEEDMQAYLLGKAEAVKGAPRAAARSRCPLSGFSRRRGASSARARPG